MDIQQRYESALQLLKKFNQQHLLNFWGQLDSAGKTKLLNQIGDIEFDRVLGGRGDQQAHAHEACTDLG